MIAMYCKEYVCSLDGCELFSGDCVLYTIACPVMADVKYQQYLLIGIYGSVVLAHTTW